MSETISRNYSHELTWFEVETGQVRFNFGAVGVDIYGDAEIVERDGVSSRIDSVWEHQGHLQAVWRLLGRSMSGFAMDDDSFRLTFEDGAMIRCKNKKAYDFVKVWESDLGYETGYPSVLGTPDPVAAEAMREMILGPYPKIFMPLPLTPKLLESLAAARAQRPIYTPPPPRPFVPRVAEGEAGKTITLDKDDEFLRFTVDPEAVTVVISGLKARFNHSFEVVDADGRVHESIDAKARTGDLDALWKLVPPAWRGWRWMRSLFGSVSRMARSSALSTKSTFASPISNKSISGWLPTTITTIRCRRIRNIIPRISSFDPGPGGGVRSETLVRAQV
jgi:hypothetical protein